MSEFTFDCAHCGATSGFGRRAGTAESGADNPYARRTRKYRCELCAKINEVEKTGYDWSRIDREG